MEIKEVKVERVEYRKYYVAADGSQFASEEECRKYEETAKCVINKIFKSVPQQKQAFYQTGLDIYGCDDSLYAIKIRDENDLETVNKWLISEFKPNGEDVATYGVDAIGTIQLFDVDGYESIFWMLGTPDDLKKRLCDSVDALFNTLVEKPEEKEGENE